MEGGRLEGGQGGGGPLIERIELTPLFVPFREIVREAMKPAGGLGMAIAAEEEWTGGDFVICVLVAEDGTRGLGEAFVWLPETGVGTSQVISMIREALWRYVIGESPSEFERINRRMDANVTRNEVAKGLLDMASYDLAARLEGREAADLMGGRVVDEVPLAALVPLMDPGSMAWLVRVFYDGGMRTFRCKLGNSVEEDVAIMERVRSELGDGVRLRVDYNQAYSCEEAVRAIKAIEPFGIEFAEQPVGATDFVGMAYVQSRVDAPLMAHEGCFSLDDIRTLAALGAIGVVGVNAERPGGVTRALRAINFAEERGLGAVIHNQSLGIAAAVQMNVAACRPHALGHAPELFGNVMFESELIAKPIDYVGGTAMIPSGPGWGVELDEDALERYATGPTIVVKD